MLQAIDLWKSYGDKPAVAGVSLNVIPGEIVGLLGPNGAGKSTTVAMICGITRCDRGSVTVGGQPIGEDTSEVKRRIGLVPQDLALHEDLPAIAKGLAIKSSTGASLEDVFLHLTGRQLRD